MTGPISVLWGERGGTSSWTLVQWHSKFFFPPLSKHFVLSVFLDGHVKHITRACERLTAACQITAFWVCSCHTRAHRDSNHTNETSNVSVTLFGRCSCNYTPRPAAAHFPRSRHLAGARPSHDVSSARWHRLRRATASQRTFHLIISVPCFHVEAMRGKL